MSKVPKKKNTFYEDLERRHKESSQRILSQSRTPSAEAQEDPVNSPKHYARGGIEVIEVLEKKMSPEAFKGFLMGNVLKYVLRHEYKNGKQDLEKASWYLRKMIDGSCSTDKQIQ